MALTDVRQAIADALSTISGVIGYTKPPSTLRAGDAWPRLGGLARDQLSGQHEVTWRTFVILPADEDMALATVEELVSELDAVLPGYVLVHEVVNYQTTSSATVPALQTTFIRE